MGADVRIADGWRLLEAVRCVRMAMPRLVHDLLARLEYVIVAGV